MEQKDLAYLDSQIEGEILDDELSKIIYATDASVYRVIPTAVALPKTQKDLVKIVEFANSHRYPIIPRAAGTSLAGQCVGEGIVVDISRHFTEIIELNVEEKWVRVQPGVIRDQLNDYLEPFGLFFSPITSTANRAMIGGMVGNNSSGTTSIKYGCTRDKILELDCILSDGSTCKFENIDKGKFIQKTHLETLEGKIYQFIYEQLKSKEKQSEIIESFPKPSIHRRNTGYALDALINNQVFTDKDQMFNMSALIAGSEGTLALISEVKLALDPLSPPEVAVVAAHFNTINDSMKATQVAMQHEPYACELMDKIILDCTKGHLLYEKYRDFVQADPAAILMVELRATTKKELDEIVDSLLQDLLTNTESYANPVIYGSKTTSLWKLRSAGLGLLANIKGGKKAVACIEDTAVALEDLPDYIDDFTSLMERFNQRSVYYAHAGAGEIHLRPILDLKKAEDVQDFHDITLEVAKLVKKYRGSLSGEHGDGRVRAEFIPIMVGEDIYKLFQEIKLCFDPHHIFNPGKIVDAPAMQSALRQEVVQDKKWVTMLDFTHQGGLLGAAEQCNGSGDCRKLPSAGGTMCPSYHATKNEKDTTRARANTLREILSTHDNTKAFEQKVLHEVMDLCLSCKACASECPSNVDMASLKAEVLHQYYQTNRIPLRSRVFANINTLQKFAYKARWAYHLTTQQPLISSLFKSVIGIAKKRSIPRIEKLSTIDWYTANANFHQPSKPIKSVYFFCDEFTNYQDSNIGIKAIQLVMALGYEVELVDHAESGRAAISKGLLKMAKSKATQNVNIFSKLISNKHQLIGLEPSALLTFRDEYPKIVEQSLKSTAANLAQNCLLIDEFLAQEIKLGNITSASFHDEKKQIVLHGHCHQKALASSDSALWALSLPTNYHVQYLDTGCCGMAGSFGFEKEHFDISQQVAEQSLFPSLRKTNESTIIAATGTSCRHQIKDGLNKKAYHPVEILYQACNSTNETL